MRRFAAVALSLACILTLPARAGAGSITGEVKVSDGDTLVSVGDKLTYSIRLFGIDSPEMEQRCKKADGSCYPCGDAARDHLRAMVDDKQVRCELTGALTYGRVVAVCYLRGRDLNQMMLRDGWAFAYRRFLDDVAGKKDAYLAAEAEAKSAKRGIWQGDFVLPSDWRNKGERLEGCE